MGGAFASLRNRLGRVLGGCALAALLAACGDTDTGVGGTPADIAPKVVSSRGVDTGGDRRADVVLLSNTGRTLLWTMNGAQVTAQSELGGVGPDWRVVDASGDYDGDGRTDILWRHTDGTLSIWFMNGATRVGTASPGRVDNGWELIDGRGDYDGDGRSDLLWRNAAGTVAVWRMNGATIAGTSFPATVPLEWSIIDGSGDYDGDGRSDILWRNTSGVVAIWRMSGTGIASAAFLPGVGPEWTAIDGTGDYDGDGRSDILWRNANGDVLAWYMNGGVAATASLGSADANWRVLDAASDFNGDGRSDILWQHSSGQVLLWTVSGTARTSAVSVGTVGAEWRVAAGSGVRTVQGLPPPPAAQCTPGLKGGFSGGADERIVPVVATRRGEVGWFESASPGLGGDGAGGVDGGLGVGVSLGQLSGATVEVEFADGRRFGPQVVGDDGMVTLVSCGYRGTALLSVRGGPGATYYDEARRTNVSFAGQLLQTAVDLDTARRETRGIGITPFTQAALAYLEQTLNDNGNSTASVGEPAKFVAKAPTPGWHDRALVARANDRIREVINEQLPGVYRLQNIARKPILLNARNASTLGTLPDNDSGRYGAVVGGLVSVAGVNRPGELAPALGLTAQLASDLADGFLDMRSGTRPIAGTDALLYSFPTLWSSHSAQSGLIIDTAGTEELRRKRTLLSIVTAYRGKFDDVRNPVSRTTYMLRSDGRLFRELRYSGTPLVPDETVLEAVSENLRFSTIRRVANGMVGLLLSGNGWAHFRIAHDGRQFELRYSLPLLQSARIVEFFNSKDSLGYAYEFSARLSNGKYFVFDPRTGDAAEYSLPESVITYACRSNVSPSLGEIQIDGDGNPITFPHIKVCYGVTSSGFIVRWQPVERGQPTSGTRGSHLPVPTDVVQVSSDNGVTLALTRDGNVFQVDIDQSVVYLDNGRERIEEYVPFASRPEQAGVSREYPSGTLPFQLAMPKACFLHAPFIVACDGAVYVAEYKRWYSETTLSFRVGASAVRRLTKVAIRSPIWRVTFPESGERPVNAFGDAVFHGIDGNAYSISGELVATPSQTGGQ
jgi:hypothetical protein